MSTVEELTARLPARVARWANLFVAAELCFGVDPYVLAAIIDRESLGGDALTPKGPAGTGDHGHGRGLGQIDDRYHHRFVHAGFDDGRPLWKHPVFNVMYAAWLLGRNLGLANGDYPVAIAAYNCGASRALAVLKELPGDDNIAKRIERLDPLTTNKYVSGVLAIRAQFLESKGVGHV